MTCDHCLDGRHFRCRGCPCSECHKPAKFTKMAKPRRPKAKTVEPVERQPKRRYSKLSELARLEILSKLHQGVPVSRLAREFQVDRKTIYSIKADLTSGAWPNFPGGAAQSTTSACNPSGTDCK